MKRIIALAILTISSSNSSAKSMQVAQTIHAPASENSQVIEVDKLHFKTSSEGFLLDGEILKNSKQSGKMPVVIYLVGSGESSTTKNNMDLIEFFLKKTLLVHNAALAYFDKRGVGKSEGVWYETSFEQRALDAKNVALELHNYDFIDKEQIFLVGHSQGGWIVQIALAQHPEVFAGGISMAGPSFGVERQLVNDYQSRLICKKGLEEGVALKQAKRRAKRDLFLVSLFGWKGNLKQLKLIRNFDPKPYISAIQKPLLMMFADNDPLVNSKWGVESLKAIFPGGFPPFIDYYVAEGENHSFKLAPKCYDGKWHDISFSATTREKIDQWFRGQLLPSQ